MKKLFLFILILFGVLTTQAFAWNYGCGENIPPSVCGADGSKSGNSIPSYTPPTNNESWIALAFDETTGISAISNSLPSKTSAKNSALFICQNSGGNKCKFIAAGSNISKQRSIVAISQNNKVFTTNVAKVILSTGYSEKRYAKSLEDYTKAKNDLLQKCEEKSETSCKNIFDY